MCKNGDILQKSATFVQAEGRSAPKSATFWPNFTFLNTFLWGGGVGQEPFWPKLPKIGGISPGFAGGWESGSHRFLAVMAIWGAFWGSVGATWGILGALWGISGGLFGAFWGILEHLGGTLGPF